MVNGGRQWASMINGGWSWPSPKSIQSRSGVNIMQDMIWLCVQRWSNEVMLRFVGLRVFGSPGWVVDCLVAWGCDSGHWGFLWPDLGHWRPLLWQITWYGMEAPNSLDNKYIYSLFVIIYVHFICDHIMATRWRPRQKINDCILRSVLKLAPHKDSAEKLSRSSHMLRIHSGDQLGPSACQGCDKLLSMALVCTAYFPLPIFCWQFRIHGEMLLACSAIALGTGEVTSTTSRMEEKQWEVTTIAPR